MAIRYLLAISVIALISVTSGPALCDETSLRLDEIEALGIQNSPLIETAKRNYLSVQAERKEGLTWQNPELGFERATAEDDAEQVIALGKEFEMPWVYGKRRSSWKHKLDAAGYAKDSEIRLIISELKSGYVELQLMNLQVADLDSLVSTLQKLFDSTREQWEAGTLSGVERQMIHFSLIDIMAELNELKREYRALESAWLNDMGLTHLSNVSYVTPVYYSPFDLMDASDYSTRYNLTPLFKQKKAEVASSKEQLGLEKGSLIPAISVEAGYRTVSPDFTGYKVGLGIPLPLLNRNSSRIQQKKLDLQAKEADLAYYKYSLKAELEQLVLSIQDQMKLLDGNSSCMLTMDSYLDGVILAYKEGWMSLPEMLEGIELYVKGQTSLNRLVATYYSDIFKLEAITGDNIVTLPEIEGEN